jgi:hypothetical protein
MKRIAFTLVVAMLVLGVLSQRATSAFDSGPSATGGFHFLMEDGNTRFVQFHARLDGSNARGSMSYSGPSDSVGGEEGTATTTGVQMTADFDCMRVEGNRAVMGGAISSSNIAAAIGQRVLLVVEDNGEGIVAEAPDRLTWGVYGLPATGWIPQDSEREGDNGFFLNWIATDAERPDDLGIPFSRGSAVGCQTFPLSSYSFVDIGHGNGNLQVQP